MFGYIYKTTDINDKVYIGQHHGEFDINYFADDESRSIKEYRSYFNKQHDEIIKRDGSMKWNWVPKELTSIKGRELILDYIQKKY